MARVSKAPKFPPGKNLFELFGPGTFGALHIKLERDEFVDKDELALALRQNPGVALPKPIHEYLIRWLEGKVKRPRGRKPRGSVKEVRDALAGVLYREYLAEFQREAKSRRNRNGRSQKREQSPHEKAAEEVARELFPNHTAAYVLNLVSKRG